MKGYLLALLFAALINTSCDTSPSDMTQSIPPSIDIDTRFDVNVRYRQRDTTYLFTVKKTDAQYLGREHVIVYSTPEYPVDLYLTTDPDGDVATAEDGGDWFLLPVGSKTQITHDPYRTHLMAGNYKITETTVTPKGQETFMIKGKAYIGDVFEAVKVGTYYNAADVKQNVDTTRDKHVYSKDIGFWLEQQFDVGSPDVQTNTLLDFRF